MVVALTTATAALAQRTITGTVVEKETKEAVIQATVALLNTDSTLVANAVTDMSGQFKVTAPKDAAYIVRITYIGFKTYTKRITVAGGKPLPMGTITIEPDSKMLKNVDVVKNIAKVTTKDDTIIYNAGAYRTPEGSVVEELIKKLPGAEVADDGTVTINGKTVQKVKVDGKEFMTGDTKTAIKNLPTSIVDRIKTYDEKSDLSRVTGIDDGNDQVVLDFGLKKGMNRGMFANVDAGVGTKSRYSGRGMGAIMQDNTRAMAFVNGNNTNDMGFGGGGGGFDMGDIFEQFFGGGVRSRTRARQQGPTKGADLRYDLSISFEDAAFGKEMTINVPRMETCEECEGTGAAKGTSPETCPDCNGTGMRQTTTRTPFGMISNARPCERCHGTGKIIKNPCGHCHGSGKVRVNKDIKVNIPKGVDEGNRLRIQNGGQAGERGGANGDLYVYINIKPHPIFQRDGVNVYCEIPITFVQAALGATVDAPTIDGKVDLKIPEGIQSGTVLKIRGKGIQRLRGEGRGDEFVKIKVLTPKNLSAYQRKLLQDFDKGGNENNNPEQKSFLDKLKGLFS